MQVRFLPGAPIPLCEGGRDKCRLVLSEPKHSIPAGASSIVSNMGRRNVALWTLYDFANSIVFIAFFLYFSQWLVVEKGVSDLWYNVLFAVSSLLLLITAPIAGYIADRTGKQRQYISYVTVFTFLCFLLTAICTLFFTQKIWLAVTAFLFAQYFYQLSFVFYNALLRYIAPPEQWGRVSGIGQAGSWLGEIAGLIIALPLASGALYLMGEPGRAQVFLPATVIFFVLTLPMLLLLKVPAGHHDWIFHRRL